MAKWAAFSRFSPKSEFISWSIFCSSVFSLDYLQQIFVPFSFLVVDVKLPQLSWDNHNTKMLRILWILRLCFKQEKKCNLLSVRVLVTKWSTLKNSLHYLLLWCWSRNANWPSQPFIIERFSESKNKYSVNVTIRISYLKKEFRQQISVGAYAI